MSYLIHTKINSGAGLTAMGKTHKRAEQRPSPPRVPRRQRLAPEQGPHSAVDTGRPGSPGALHKHPRKARPAAQKQRAG